MDSLLMFNDEKLLHRALTHRSYVNENPKEDLDNERLEFLGDAILNFISGEYLYQLNPEMGEGEMSRRRAALVDEKQLAIFATEVGLNLRMRLGKGLMDNGGYQNPNLLSSTFEAVVGAYYLDHQRDIELIRTLVEKLFDSVPDEVMTARSDIDPRNKFQEYIQKNGAANTPEYRIERLGGPDHAPEFIARVFVENKIYGEGKGRSKDKAKETAAEDALDRLRNQGKI